MTEVVNENPAERAVDFLLAFQEVSRDSMATTVGEILAELYDCEDTDTAKLITIVREIWSLPEQIRNEVLQIPNLDGSSYDDVVNQLESVVSRLALDRQYSDITELISKSLITMLRMVGALLRKDVYRSSLSQEQRNSILQQLTSVLNDIDSTEMDPEFAAFARVKVLELINAIELYDVLGATAVIERVDSMFGGLMRQSPSIRNSTVKKSITKSMLKAGAAILLALNIANGALDLEQKIVDVLEPKSQVMQTKKDSKQSVKDEKSHK